MEPVMWPNFDQSYIKNYFKFLKLKKKCSLEKIIKQHQHV